MSSLNGNFTKFSQCRDFLVAQPNSTFPNGNAINNGAKILTYFESKYNCSGVCKPALFYWSLPLSYGVPSVNCLSYLKNEIGSNMRYIGVTGVVTGGLMFFIFIC